MSMQPPELVSSAPPPRLTVGATIAHYEILEKIGQGGMGEVFLARDTRLGRRLALKTLAEPYTSNWSRLERFKREARAVASLSHPNIVTLYSDEFEEGVHFLTMEFVSGEALERSIPKQGFSLERLFEIAIPLIDAIDTAHAKGITHRDLKPDNIMIDEDGRVRVLDFGLAKLRETPSSTFDGSAPTELLTREGIQLGTVPYMSPEQLEGREADERSDIFALGAILYQMATGSRPFQGSSSAELVSAILRDEPPSVEQSRSELPHHLSRIIRRCLEKDPAHRYQVVKDLENDLADLQRELLQPAEDAAVSDDRSRFARASRVRHLALVAAAAVALLATIWVLAARPDREPPAVQAAVADLAPQEVRIAVLPAMLSASGDASGDLPVLIQALLSTDLTGAERVRVLDPHGLAGLFANGQQAGNPTERAEMYERLRKAEVDFAVETTVHSSDDGFRLLGRLVDARTQDLLYSADAEAATRDELAGGARRLAGDLLSYIQVEVFQLAQDENLRPWVSVHEHDIEAVKAFIQATEYFYRYEPGGAEYLRRALEIDPDFVVARTWLVAGLAAGGKTEAARSHYEYLRGLENRASPLERAMIDLAGAYVANDLPVMAKHLQFILEYSPGNHIVLANLGEVQAEMGDCPSAIQTVLPVAEARWRYPPLWSLLGRCLIQLGDLESARQRLEQGRTLGRMLPASYAMLEALCLLAGDDEAAESHHRAWAESAQVDAGEPVPEVASHFEQIATVALERGQPAGAARLARRAVAYDPGSATSLDLLALARFQMGDLEQARNAGAAALAIDPTSARTHLTLARVAEREGESKVAADHYRSYLELLPGGSERAEIERRLSALSGAVSNGGQG